MYQLHELKKNCFELTKNRHRTIFAVEYTRPHYHLAYT